MNIRSTPPRPACASSRSSNSKPRASIGGSSKRIKASRIFRPLGPSRFAHDAALQTKKGTIGPLSSSTPLQRTNGPSEGPFNSSYERSLQDRPLLVLSLPVSPVEGGDYRRIAL